MDWPCWEMGEEPIMPKATPDEQKAMDYFNNIANDPEWQAKRKAALEQMERSKQRLDEMLDGSSRAAKLMHDLRNSAPMTMLRDRVARAICPLYGTTPCTCIERHDGPRCPDVLAMAQAAIDEVGAAQKEDAALCDLASQEMRELPNRDPHS